MLPECETISVPKDNLSMWRIEKPLRRKFVRQPGGRRGWRGRRRRRYFDRVLTSSQIQELEREADRDERAKNLREAENYRIEKKAEREREQTEERARRRKLGLPGSTAKVSSSQPLISKFLTESAGPADTKRLSTDNEDDLESDMKEVDSEFDCSDPHNDSSIGGDLVSLPELYQTILDGGKILGNWDEVGDLEPDLDHHPEVSGIEGSRLLDSIFGKCGEINPKV